MFLERKLKGQDVWINIDSDDVKQTAQIYQDYKLTKKPLSMLWIKMNGLTWTIIARMVQLSLSTMSLI